MQTRPLAFSLFAALSLPAALFAGNGSVIRSPLANSGLDADATGTIFSSLQSKKSDFAVELAGLTPRGAYSLTVGTLTEAEFTPDSKGRARLRFTTGNSRSRALLDFDPRGKIVAVLDSTGFPVLQAVMSGEGEVETISVDERADLLADAGVSGKAAARYTVQRNGKRSFEVVVSDATESTLVLLVNGIDRSDITMRRGKGKVTFSSSPRTGDAVLDFDPRSAHIELFAVDGTLKFSGTLEAKAKGVNFDTRTTRSAFIPATTAAPAGAKAEAKLRIEANATRDFSVELEGVPAGAYELLVNDVVEGTIEVTSRVGGTQGEIEFTTDDDDDAGELPLNFNPVGATLTIRQSSTVLFSGPFNLSAAGNAPQPGTTLQVVEMLASTGLDPDAKSEAEFSTQANGEAEFEVEVEDLNAGSYELFVGGTLRGTITAAAEADGRVRGKLKFESSGAGDDRVRATRRGTDDGSGGGSGHGGGTDDPSGDDRGGSGGGGGTDDPSGDDRGGSGGGGGTDDPSGDDHGGSGGGSNNDGGGVRDPRLPLNFDPRGQLIEIKSATGIFFSHVFGDGSATGTGGTGATTVPAELAIALVSSGAGGNATAEAEWKRDDRGHLSFEIEVEDLNTGSFELLIGGTARGTISVVATDRGTRGKIEFDDEPDAFEQPLTFDPLGKVITIQANGIVYFERAFPSAS